MLWDEETNSTWQPESEVVVDGPLLVQTLRGAPHIPAFLAAW